MFLDLAFPSLGNSDRRASGMGSGTESNMALSLATVGGCLPFDQHCAGMQLAHCKKVSVRGEGLCWKGAYGCFQAPR
jgi:hypothetical protein